MRPTLTLFIVTAIFALVMSGHGYAGQMEHGGTMIRLDHTWARRAPMLGQEGPRAQSGGTMTHGNGAVYVAITNLAMSPMPCCQRRQTRPLRSSSMKRSIRVAP